MDSTSNRSETERARAPEINRRGSAVIWTATSLTSGHWPSGRLRTEDQSVVIEALGRSLCFVPSEVIEVRRFRWPFPTLTLVTRTDDGHALAHFSVLSANRLDQIQSALGLKTTFSRRWHLGTGLEDDRQRYGLCDPSD